jgi:Tol biopolymer transport system component
LRSGNGALVLAAAIFGLWATLAAQDIGRLKYVATAHQVAIAHQYGPVGYRDPLGVISPSGEWLAYSTAYRLFVQRVAGGPVTELPPCNATIRHLAWLPDDETLVVDSGDAQARWWSYNRATGTRHLLWPERARLAGRAVDSGHAVEIPLAKLEQMVWSADNRKVAGVAHTAAGTELWILNSDGSNGEVLSTPASLTFPAWAPDGRLACLSFSGGAQTLSFPCGAKSNEPSLIAYGPVAFSPDGKQIYAGVPNTQGTLDLWSRAISSGGPGTQLTQFATDTYAPSVARTGAVLFKRSDYRTFVSVAPAHGGVVMPLALFQSMTPTWSPNGEQIALTFGSWRRVVDDFHYPDIAQDIGLISSAGQSPARAPARVVLASPSEDQGLCWSPNGKWMVLHSHQDLSDDLWIQPADGSREPQLLTHFGRPAETDWPRWSPDGKWVMVAAYKHGAIPLRHVIYLIGVDQLTGTVTATPREVPLDGFSGEITHAEWNPGSGGIVFQAFRNSNQQTIYVVPRTGGRPAPVFHFIGEQHVAGFGVSPDGAWIAYPAPANDGYLQLFRIRLAAQAGVRQLAPEQLTFDPSNKTQPSYSPDGARIAFTVWSYEVQFWTWFSSGPLLR